MNPFRNRQKYIHPAAILFSVVMLCFMAFYNGYPLAFNHDTGAYIENGFSGMVRFDRPILYGLFIYFTSFQWSLWLVVIAQALIVSLVTYYYFLYFSSKPNFIPFFIGFIIVISFFMGASFNVSWLMPDIFTPVSFLCLGLLIFINELKKRDLIIISSFAIVSIAMHNSNFYICLGLTLLLLAGFIVKPLYRIYMLVGIRLKKVAFVFLLVIISNVFLSSVHYLYGGGFKSSRGGVVFLMANMVEMGIVDTYLAENCGKKKYNICTYKDSLPNNFLWVENTPMNKTGGWEVSAEEYGIIVKDILTTPKYLKTFIYKSGVYTLKQFFNFDTGFDQKSSTIIEKCFNPVNLYGDKLVDLFLIKFNSYSKSIYIMFLFRNIIQEYDYSGKLIKQFSIPGLPDISELFTKNIFSSDKVPTRRILSDFSIDRWGNIFVLGRGVSESSNTIYIINNNYLFDTISLPHRSTLIRIDNFSNIYCTNTQLNKVYKYNIKNDTQPIPN